jgi:hypothetical protein
MRQLDTVFDKIIEVVNKVPEAKKNKNLLVTEYWKLEGAETLADSANCTSSESIIREFRYMVKDGTINVSDDKPIDLLLIKRPARANRRRVRTTQ